MTRVRVLRLGRPDHGRGVFFGHGHGLLAEHVVTGLERRPRQRQVRVARRANVDQVEVVAADQRLVRIADVGDAEGPRHGLGQPLLRVGNGHQLAAGVAGEAGEVGRLGPGAGAKNADAHATRGRHDYDCGLRAPISFSSGSVLSAFFQTSRNSA